MANDNSRNDNRTDDHWSPLRFLTSKLTDKSEFDTLL